MRQGTEPKETERERGDDDVRWVKSGVVYTPEMTPAPEATSPSPPDETPATQQSLRR